MIFTLLATIGGAIAAAGTTVATTAAAVGGAVAANGAAVATGAAVIGAVAGAAHTSGYDKGHKEGYGEGFSDASKIYEEKFTALRKEAQKAYGIISEQKRLLREADELIAEMQSYIDIHKAIGLTVEPGIAHTYAEARIFADGLRRAA